MGVGNMLKVNKDMCEGPLLGNIITYTIPIMLTGILQLLFNAADLVVVGRFCGSVSVAAVGATGALTALLTNLFMGLSVGAGVSLAHALGSHDYKAAHRVVHTAMPTAAICGLILSVLGICFSKQLLIWMDTPNDVLPYSALYMKIYFGGMIFNMIYNFGASILRAAGETQKPLFFLTLAGILNVILNVIFVTVFDMNVAGVAVATTASQALSATLVVIYLMKRTDCIQFIPKSMTFHSKTLLNILRVGIPSGIQASLFSISNVIVQSSINSFGEIVMSGNAAAANIEGFVYITVNSFYQTTLNFVGQNTGAGKYDRVKKVLLICLGCVTLVGLVLGSVIYLFGEQLLSIYITDSAEAITYGMIRFSFVSLPYFLCGIMEVATGALRGLGAAFTPMILSVVGVCGIRIAWVFTVFQYYHTQQSLYLSYPISWAMTLGMLLVAFCVIYKRRMALQPRLTQKAEAQTANM